MGAQIVLAGGTVMHTYRHNEQYRTIQIDIDGSAEGIPDAGDGLGTTVTRDLQIAPVHLTDMARRVIEWST